MTFLRFNKFAIKSSKPAIFNRQIFNSSSRYSIGVKIDTGKFFGTSNPKITLKTTKNQTIWKD